ncbi:MAG: FAD-binding oxidoreductase [Deltaproteobacteria bacterium]|nr:FAD-binding oxidoreductase [Deltaproteobacteria bacterium]
MSIKKTDVIVIGGGAIGSSIAFHLARHKIGVILLEKGGLASGSSGACDGLVFLQSKKPGIHLELALASLKLFKNLADRLPMDMEFRQAGGLVVIESEAELEVMKSYVAEQRATGLEVSLLDAAETRRLEPCLAENIVGAAYSPMDSQVNPIRMTLALALGAKEGGAEIITDSPVTGMEQIGAGTWSVTAGRDVYQAPTVVNAAGVLAPQIAAMVGLDIPIKPRRGQLIVTDFEGVELNHCLISAGYIAAKFNPEIAREAGQGVSIEQTKSGNLLLGSTREFVGFNRRTTLSGLKSIAARSSKIIPGLSAMNLIRSFAGLRPYTPDGLPCLGLVEGLEGLIMAAGHEGDGISLSLITGHLMAQLVVSGRTDIPLDDFNVARFAGMGVTDGF